MNAFKNVLLFIVLSLLVVSVSGCTSQNNEVSSNNDNFDDIISSDVDVSGDGKLSCTREATAGDGIDVDLRYEITYNNGYIKVLRAVDKVTSNNQSSLDEYEDAYNKIAANYTGLKYYDVSVIRDSNTVTNTIVVNYEKVNMDRLLEIEGEEDNVIENGKVKLSTWLGFAQKFGTTCEEV